jgi:hypothetical protein
MRTTLEIIDELQRDADGAFGCFLVVGFENTTLFVAANEPDALSKLNGMVETGGDPIGLIRVVKAGPHELRIEVRAFDEYKDDFEIEGYLERLAEQLTQKAAAFGMTPLD